MLVATKITVYNANEDVIGWVRNFGCDNSDCTTAFVNGRKWHAIPAGFAVTLNDYHFGSLEDAIYALHTAWSS